MLKIESFTKTYKGGKRAVDGLSLEVKAGDIYGFIGHNGAGKTTTLKCVAGILDFDEGEIFIDGKSIKTQDIECKKVLAYIPDNPDLYDYLTGAQYLNFIADVYGVGAEERAKRIERFSKDFEIYEWLGDLISAYSHGMRQKLAIISALLHEPKLLILDEPFVGLDPKAALKLKELMRERCAAGGAIFFSTHVLEVAEKLCNKIAIIKDGKLVVLGETEALTDGKSLESVFMEVVNVD
ncbi:MAG: ABC transporter ATP-binding protein [Clostridia bacterium]|nr:ABC transporter ATP-binding protein [Clostridia bacterium]